MDGLIDHLQAGAGGADTWPLGAHLLHSVVVATFDDGSAITLDPLTVGPTGEWEAWLWQRWETNDSYPSFGDAVARLVDIMVTTQEVRTHLCTVTTEATRAVSALEHPNASGARALQAVLASAEVDDMGDWLGALAASSGAVAGDIVVRMLHEHHMDRDVLTTLVSGTGSWKRRPGATSAVAQALGGPHGRAVATAVARHWPEPVQVAWLCSRDPRWLEHLLSSNRASSFTDTLEVLPSLSDELRHQLSVLLRLAAPCHRDPHDVAAVLTAAAALKPSDEHLACVLLEWGATSDGIALASRLQAAGALSATDEGGESLCSAIVRQGVRAAAPLLVRLARINELGLAVRALAFLDIPALVETLWTACPSGTLRLDALIGLELIAADARRESSEDARDALDELAAHDCDALRALARLGDIRAMPHLSNLLATNPRSAATGFADLCHSVAIPHLVALAEHEDDDIAATATMGLFRLSASGSADAHTELLAVLEALASRGGSLGWIVGAWNAELASASTRAAHE